MKSSLLALSLSLAFAAPLIAAQPDIVIADFEGETYGDWKTTGDAFGSGPAHGSAAAGGRERPA
jgi:fructan beta-fructosidase